MFWCCFCCYLRLHHPATWLYMQTSGFCGRRGSPAWVQVTAFLYCRYGTAGTRQPAGAVNAAWFCLHASL